MSDKQMTPPDPKLGFETEVLQLVQTLIDELPQGTATLQVSRAPGHPEWPVPFFQVIPTNPRSAPFMGIAASDDLYLTIGEVEREIAGFASGGHIARGASWRQELRWVWDAVVKGDFSQRQALDSKGRVIGGASKISLGGREWEFRGGRRAETLIGKRRYRTVAYEPYQIQSLAR